MTPTTEKLLERLSKRPWTERWLTRLLGATLSSAAYLLCLPWDLRNRPESPGSTTETTPVSVLGVVALAVTLLLLALYFGHRDALAWPLLLVAAPPATLMYLSFRTDPEPPDASLWPLTWAFSTLVMAAGVLVLASVARQFRQDTGDSTDGLVFAHSSSGASSGTGGGSSAVRRPSLNPGARS
jgi:multisubunit Na+/H+ antiporter MnhB subunit